METKQTKQTEKKKIDWLITLLPDIQEDMFVNCLVLIPCQLGKEFEMKQKRVWKNNGVSYEGLVIEKLEEELSPVVSLDRCYEDFQAGISVQEISDPPLQEANTKANTITPKFNKNKEYFFIL